MPQNISPIIFLIVATTMEVSGDAIVRLALHDHQTSTRACLFVAGTLLLLGYGCFLNLAPIEFGQVVGLYIAILFLMWQVINYIFFRTIPTVPIACGGAMIVAGGLVVTYWKN